MFDRNVITDKQKVAAAQNIKEREYWMAKFSGDWFKTIFPVDVGDTGTADGAVGRVGIKITNEVFLRLKKLSSGYEHTLHMIFTAGVTALLGRYCENFDIIVGAPIYKQKIEGEFINTVLALRSQLHPNMTFKELLIQVKQTILEANENQNYPLEALLYNLNLTVNPQSEFPLFDTVVLLESIHEKSYLRNIHTNILFSIRKETDYIEVELEYNPLLYKNSTAQRIINHLHNILCEAVLNIDARVFDLNLLSQEEKKRILYEFNDTASVYSSDKTMHRLFEEQSVKTPDYTAVICNDHHITYHKLNDRANQLVWLLKKKGIGTGCFVGVVIDRTVEMVIAVMGIIKAGAAYVPQEPDLPESRIGRIMASLNVKCIISNPPRFQKIGEIVKKLDNPPPIVCLNNDADADEISDQPVNNVVSDVTTTDIAYVIHTSGSTGTPKGVVEQHRPVVNIIEWVNRVFHVGPPDKLLCVASLGFDLSVYDIFGILATGASLSVVSGEKLRDPYQLLDAIYKEGITFWDSAPAALQQLVPFFQSSGNRKNKSCFRLVFLSGDWIPVKLPDRLRETFKGINVIALGGATEATIWSNNYPVGKVDPKWPSIPYGKPIQNASYYILDTFLHPCPIGVPGDLFIGSQCLALGYINEIELTAFKFIANPFVKGEIIYRTGDMARWFEDGNMEFLGRKDFQVKIRGHRIELGEIENQLLRHGDIETVIVITRETAGQQSLSSGKADKYLCAYYVSAKELDNSHLKEFLAKELPDYMIPPYFVKIDRIPLSPSGKLDKKALPEPVMHIEKTYVAPRNEVDITLTRMWSELLNIPHEKISIDWSIFDLGGHSLTATELVSKIHQHFNTKLPLVEVFTSPTVRQLSDYIINAETNRFHGIEPVENKSYYPLSVAQKGLYLTQQIDKKSTGYNITYILELEGCPDNNKLENTLGKLVARHESLRTFFRLIDGEPVQIIDKDVKFKIDYFDLPKTQKDIEKIIANFVQAFDLLKAPLLRTGLIKIEGQRHILIFDMHHIISDGVSMETLVNEFMVLYSDQQLPSLLIQYKDFCLWQYENMKTLEYQAQKEYWLERFKDKVPVLNTPTDHERPAIQDFQGRTIYFTLAQEQTPLLKEIAAERQVTLFMVMVAVFNIFLSKISGQEDILLGTPAAARQHPAIRNSIGMFVNMLTLRNTPQADKFFTDFLEEVKWNTLNAFENQDYRYEQLVEELKIPRDISRNPLFDVVLAMQNMAAPQLEIPGLKLKPYDYEIKTSKFDLTLQIFEEDDDLTFGFEYSTKLFVKETIEMFIGYFKKIVSTVTTNINMKLKDIALSDDLAIKKTKKSIGEFGF